MANRPKLPTPVKRSLLLESGYRCSIPTCRFPITENAHIVSWAETKDHSYENLIALCPNCHTMYDSGRIDKKALIAYKKKLLFLNEVYSRFEIDVLDYLKNHKRALVFTELMVKRLLDEGLVCIEDEVMTQGFDDNEEILVIFSIVITGRGRGLLEDWSKVDDSLTFDRL